MKRVLCGILLCGLCHLFALPLHKIEGKCVQPKDFSKNQEQVILKAFRYGVKNGFGYTMAAIAWKESCAGEYRVNFSDPSAGIYHAHIPGIIRKHKQPDSSFMRNMVGELLIRDDNFASQSALDELNYWNKVRKGNWYEVIKSYNKGFSWEKDKKRNKMAQEYFEDVARRVKALQGYISKIAPRDVKNAKNDHALNFLNNSIQPSIHKSTKSTQKSLQPAFQAPKAKQQPSLPSSTIQKQTKPTPTIQNQKTTPSQKFVILEE